MTRRGNHRSGPWPWPRIAALAAVLAASPAVAQNGPFPPDPSRDRVQAVAVHPDGDEVAAGLASATVQIVELALAEMALDPAELDFGDRSVFHAPTGMTVTVTNVGSADLVIDSFEITGSDPEVFSISSNPQCILAGGVIAPEESCEFGVVFDPEDLVTYSAFAAINSNAASGPDGLPTAGTGTGPIHELIPTLVQFSPVAPGEEAGLRTVTFVNVSGEAILFNVPPLNPSPPFNLESNNCDDGLAAGESCEVELSFAPDDEGEFEQTLETDTGTVDGYGDHFVTLRGEADADALFADGFEG